MSGNSSQCVHYRGFTKHLETANAVPTKKAKLFILALNGGTTAAQNMQSNSKQRTRSCHKPIPFEFHYGLKTAMTPQRQCLNRHLTNSKIMQCLPDAVAASRLADGPAHGDAGLNIANLAGELVDGLEQGLPSQRRGGACGSGGHSCRNALQGG